MNDPNTEFSPLAGTVSREEILTELNDLVDELNEDGEKLRHLTLDDLSDETCQRFLDEQLSSIMNHESEAAMEECEEFKNALIRELA